MLAGGTTMCLADVFGTHEVTFLAQRFDQVPTARSARERDDATHAHVEPRRRGQLRSRHARNGAHARDETAVDAGVVRLRRHSGRLVREDELTVCGQDLRLARDLARCMHFDHAARGDFVRRIEEPLRRHEHSPVGERIRHAELVRDGSERARPAFTRDHAQKRYAHGCAFDRTLRFKSPCRPLPCP
jgi:hypothetical protein